MVVEEKPHDVPEGELISAIVFALPAEEDIRVKIEHQIATQEAAEATRAENRAWLEANRATILRGAGCIALSAS